MTLLVLGPNGSGKSAYAEKLVVRLYKGDLYYIATMIPYGEEGQSRVVKHRKQRESLGFITMEKPFNVSDISVSSDTAVLLEDVSNLLSNALFEGERSGSSEFSLCENSTAHRQALYTIPENNVYKDIITLCGKCRVSVMVSISGLTVKPEYNEETQNYIDSLNSLNSRLSDFADMVITMRDGEPIFAKAGCARNPISKLFEL